MTRIIAGFAGSRKLASPAASTRPTSDRVRESIFAKLEAAGDIEGAKVLDVFAGTGALALEAISRGAESAVLIEKDRKAFEVCQKNAEMLTLATDAEVNISLTNQPAFKALENLVGNFDLVFVDPPYNLEQKKLYENLEQLVSLTKPGSVIVLEQSSRVEVSWPEQFVQESEKNYGDTKVYFLVRE